MLDFDLIIKTRNNIQNAKKIGNYALTLTYKCNWYCNYCIVNTHNQIPINIEEIKQKLNLILPNSFVALTGGEPGLVNLKDLNYIYKELKKKNCIIQVITNGTFFKYTELCKQTDFFLYHCSENLTNDIIIPKNIPIEKYSCVLVITDESYKRLDNYIDKYDVFFIIVGADSNKTSSNKLSYINALKVYNKYKNKLSKLSIISLISKYSKYEKIQML